jgi:predicted nucleic acid-binding protein
VSVVIDANALVAFVTNEPAAPRVTELFHGWGSEGTAVSAPALARYEIANALAKKAAAGSLSDDAMQEAWDVLDELPIVYHALRDGPGVVRSTLVLERRSAYDAAYLALADDLGAERGFPFVEPDSRLGDTPRHYPGRIIIRVSGVRVPPPASAYLL